MTFLPKKVQQILAPKWMVVVFLLLLISFGALPGYLSGHWQWTSPPKVQQLKQLKALKQKGLALPGWQTIKSNEIDIGGHKWHMQEVEQVVGERSTTVLAQASLQPKALLLLLPQTGKTDQPQVEWADIDGRQRWTNDLHQKLKFTVEPQLINQAQAKGAKVALNPSPIEVEARFFRGWNQQQTYAVVQWYATPQGGDPTPSHWFWADRFVQWQGHRLPWVAVSILIPISPLEAIEPTKPLAQSLAKTVQVALMTNTFHSSTP
ncbi:MAG: cyanoexosortase B system-associated protein [Scytolyngbya sp. HA4215-MV1]|jgi:cyanoexosortase B-associated protein|nr:cyanoexosortase B system-associated protein [Scytolyngbya sp. HA4215-MV1]